MAKGITVKISMLPMYADWVRNVFKAEPNGIVTVSDKNSLGILLKNLLRPEPSNGVIREYNENEFVEFIIPVSDDIESGDRKYISENSEKLFYLKVRRMFYYDLHDFIEEMSNSGVKELRRIITLFCELRGIENYKVNTLEREYRRHKKKQENFRKTQKISSTFTQVFSFLLPLLVFSSPIIVP